MWFRSVRAQAFGPLRDAELEFGKGLNIVHAPNESGKSTWHAALTVALCGLRRGPGRTAHERDFEEQHRPWNSPAGDPWKVGLEVILDDERHLEIDRNLESRITEVRDKGLGGREFHEIPVNDGSPDGARLLGLDRETFPMTASVRQASILTDLGEPDALQILMARTMSGGVRETAAGAVEAIKEFQKERVGLDRSHSTKPLRAAKNKFEAARTELDEVRERHREYLEITKKMEESSRRAADLEHKREHVVARRDAEDAKRKADDLRGRVKQFKELKESAERSGAAGPSVGDSPDPAGLRQALIRVEQLSVPATAGRGALDDLYSRRARLAEQLVPIPDLLQVQKCLELLRRPTEKRWTGLGPLIIGAIGLAAAAVVGWIVNPVAGAAAAGVALVAAWWAHHRSGPRVRIAKRSDGGSQPLVRVGRGGADASVRALGWLDAWGLPHDPNAARAEAAKRIQEKQVLQGEIQKIDDQIRRSRGFDEAGTQRLSNSENEEAWAKLRALAREHGIDGTDDEIREGARRRVEQLDEARRRRDDDLQERIRQGALQNRSLDEWRTDAEKAERALVEAQRRLAAFGDSDLPLDFDLSQLERDIRKARSDESEAKGSRSQIDQRGVDVAAAEARLTTAEEELERVDRLQDTLTTTLSFLERAAEQVHRHWAPKLAEEMRPWIGRVTNGRYTEVEIDPESLAVTLISASGDRSDARLASRGTTEQVYLVLRLVMAQTLSDAHEKCPMLLDDPTVHADAERKTRILEYLREASRDRQVIVFSQEEAVAEWARANLEAPSDKLVQLPPLP